MRRGPALLLALAALTGCAGDGATVAAGALERAVLLPEDVGAGFVQFDEGPLLLSDEPLGDEGWKARYRRQPAPEARGPLVVASRVDRFGDADAAREAFSATRAEAAAAGGGLVDAPEVGDESYATTLLQPGARGGVRFYTVRWRDRNVVATLDLNGFERDMGVADATRLARKQARRVAAAR